MQLKLYEKSVSICIYCILSAVTDSSYDETFSHAIIPEGVVTIFALNGIIPDWLYCYGMWLYFNRHVKVKIR